LWIEFYGILKAAEHFFNAELIDLEGDDVTNTREM
jgi:hypothetical protein